jgi:hypothetical protein
MENQYQELLIENASLRKDLIELKGETEELVQGLQREIEAYRQNFETVFHVIIEI